MDKREQLYQANSNADDVLLQLLPDTAMEYKNNTPDAHAQLPGLLIKRRNERPDGQSKSCSRAKASSRLSL